MHARKAQSKAKFNKHAFTFKRDSGTARTYSYTLSPHNTNTKQLTCTS